MQTFLPYPSFTESAKCLDNKRLGKQRVEAYTILKILLEKRTKGGWVNHPAVKMWRGFESSLYIYLREAIAEWAHRGFEGRKTIDNVVKLEETYYELPKSLSLDWAIPIGRIKWPTWYSEKFHSSHRAALLFKDPKHYGQFGWTEEPKIDYVWPVR